MSVYEKISGFADEISQDFDQQLKTVTDLGMKYICIRSAEHKGIADYTPEEVRTVLLPKLRPQAWAFPAWVRPSARWRWTMKRALPSSWSSWKPLCETAKLLDCSFIRMFSFLIPKDARADSYTDVVLDKLRQLSGSRKSMTLSCSMKMRRASTETPVPLQIAVRPAGLPPLQGGVDFANFVQCEQDTAECWGIAP